MIYLLICNRQSAIDTYFCEKQVVKKIWFLLLLVHSDYLIAQQKDFTFKIIPLGVYGSAHEGNLSSYMLAVKNSNDYVCLDAGTVHDGIDKAIDKKTIEGSAAGILKKDIKGYLISHPHLDHVAGLIINSPDDSSKNIYGLPFCINTIREKYFSWKSWANFGDEGEKPLLKKYHYVTLSEDLEMSLINTDMFVRPFELSHSNPNKSTAFLIRYNSSYVLYLGDTGADTIENSDKLTKLWHYIAPLVQRDQLKGIFIEVSFPDEQPADKLFGHLTPGLFFSEMKKLSSLTGENNLRNIPVIITHIKPNGNNEMLIKKELAQKNDLQLSLIFPQQGEMIKL
ncbi:MAG TPA: 3',5'-cyclic-nucleotide phosphodiesterase [Parafilimonas sp.]|nr:3',5'-cyclic-nucleotide phosphodiesterase [Parafilimonas sp.]